MLNGTISTSNVALTRYGFTGREHEAGIEDYIYFRSRYYHAGLGRFIQHDIGYLDGYNLYGGYFAMWGGIDPWGYGTYTRRPNLPSNYDCMSDEEKYDYFFIYRNLPNEIDLYVKWYRTESGYPGGSRINPETVYENREDSIYWTTKDGEQIARTDTVAGLLKRAELAELRLEEILQELAALSEGEANTSVDVTDLINEYENIRKNKADIIVNLATRLANGEGTAFDVELYYSIGIKFLTPEEIETWAEIEVLIGERFNREARNWTIAIRIAKAGYDAGLVADAILGGILIRQGGRYILTRLAARRGVSCGIGKTKPAGDIIRLSDDIPELLAQVGDEGDVFLGVIGEDGIVRLYRSGPPSSGLPSGHQDLLNQGIITTASRGFSIGVKNGEVVVIHTDSMLNSLDDGFRISQEFLDFIKENIPMADGVITY